MKTFMKYSVLMSLYERTSKDELMVSIESMLNQTIPPDQFIIVEDGPIKNETQDYIATCLNKNPELFSVLDLKTNHGLAFALNKGLEIARNELIARMDSDDYSLPHRCEKQIEAFIKDKKLHLVGSNIGFFKESPLKPTGAVRIFPDNHQKIKKILRRNDPFCHPAVMFKKSSVLSAGGYDIELRRRQDYDLFSKMVNHFGMKATNVQEILLLFRDDDNFSLRNKSVESCKSRVFVQKKIFKRGDCSLFDFLFVCLMMFAVRIIPNNLYRKIYIKIKNKKRKSL